MKMNCEYSRSFCESWPEPPGRRRIRHRRRRRRYRANIILRPCLSIVLFLFATARQTSAFYGHRQKINDEEHSHVQHHDRGAFFRSSLQSFAEKGASKWGDYVSSANKSKSMTRSSTLYISQLHQRIQRMRSNSDGHSDSGISTSDHRLKDSIDPNDEDVTSITAAPSENFTQEIIAAMLGGAAAGSAFAAATAGAFAATAIMALGAIVTVIFSEEKEEMLLPADEVVVMYDDINTIADQIIEEAGCDYNGEEHDVENSILPSAKQEPMSSHQKLLPEFILEELIRCYNGNPDYASSLFPMLDASDACIANVSESSGPYYDSMGTENELLLVEPSTIVDENLPPMEHDIPKRVEVVWHDTRLGKSRDNNLPSSNLPPPKRAERSLQSSASVKPRISSDTSSISLTDAERDGALLLAESFRAASSALGLLASGVRFAGETAAATAGGTARLAGGVVRLSGWAVGSLGEAIENSGSGQEIDAEQNLVSSSGNSDLKMKNKRIVAGTSVRLIGDAIEQIADSLLLAGSATEHVAFAATGVAEGTLRIMENSLTRISDIFSREGRRGSSTMSSFVEMESKVNVGEFASDLDEISTFAVSKCTPEEAITSTQAENETVITEVQKLCQLFSTWVSQSADLIVSDTVGVPSLAMEMLGVFLLCFVASVFVLRSDNSIRSSGIEADAGGDTQCTISFGNRCESATSHRVAEDDSHTTLTVESTMRGPDFDNGKARSMHLGVATFVYIFFVPLKLAQSILILAWGVFYRKEAALLVFYLLGWIFLSRSAQSKSSIIHRKSELIGFQLATLSVDKDSPSIESSVWLNSLIHRAWRVKSGGLEPMLSSYLSSKLAESFSQPYSKSSGVAHVALDTFTLGSSPPLVSRIECRGVDDKDESKLLMRVDVGMLFHDAVLLLDIKPSSLEYRSLPSTKISVNSLDAKATFDLAVKFTQDYPYISFLDVSLVEVPDFNLRIEPQSESGLKGVDLGSIPILSSWIKSSISSSLAYYLSPQHISIDILAWLRGDEIVVT